MARRDAPRERGSGFISRLRVGSQHQHRLGKKGASASRFRIARVEARLETSGSRLDDVHAIVCAFENIRGWPKVFLSETRAHARWATRSALAMANFTLLSMAPVLRATIAT